mmetsp:Transcript_5617/g.23346  ORF Transcript_5617/g.23346 Transcript_5617/m.23346 type:complete len:253 (-) Transcript_5617:304-1062(-)
MAAPCTPLFTAYKAVSILGSMPPRMTPSSMSVLAVSGVTSSTRRPSPSSTPGTSVSNRSRDAPRAAATAPAAVSAFKEKASSLLPVPAAMGAMTGMTRWSRSDSRRSALTDSGVPTKPRSTAVSPTVFLTSFSATMSESSRPESPSAWPPAEAMAAEMALLIEPSTISATSIVAASVTRRPSTKRVGTWSRSSISPICGPPPCTTTGLTPRRCMRTTSLAKQSAACASLIAWPPYLTTTRFPAWCENSSSAS